MHFKVISDFPRGRIYFPTNQEREIGPDKINFGKDNRPQVFLLDKNMKFLPFSGDSQQQEFFIDDDVTFIVEVIFSNQKIGHIHFYIRNYIDILNGAIHVSELSQSFTEQEYLKSLQIPNSQMDNYSFENLPHIFKTNSADTKLPNMPEPPYLVLLYAFIEAVKTQLTRKQ